MLVVDFGVLGWLCGFCEFDGSFFEEMFVEYVVLYCCDVQCFCRVFFKDDMNWLCGLIVVYVEKKVFVVEKVLFESLFFVEFVVVVDVVVEQDFVCVVFEDVDDVEVDVFGEQFGQLVLVLSGELSCVFFEQCFSCFVVIVDCWQFWSEFVQGCQFGLCLVQC